MSGGTEDGAASTEDVGGGPVVTLRSASERAVVVLAGAQGSGVMLTPRLVLTSAHVLRDKEWIRTVHPTGERPLPSRVVWRDDDLDVALLLAGEELIEPERWSLSRLRLGSAATPDALPGCQAVGFPRMQRFDDGARLEYDQLTGVVLPMAGRMRSTLVCEFDRTSVDDPPSGPSPFAGLSGAPLFAGAVLIGVVVRVPAGRDHRRVEAVPIERIMAAPHFPRQVADTVLDRFVSPVTEALEPADHAADERFERYYGRALRARYRKIEIFGIDELGTTETTWDLDTAYLSLEAGAVTSVRNGSPVGRARSEPSRINDLLADRPRTLLRGEAGAGKTTLVWWLAAHAACGAMDHDLAELNDLVPFVVPMRSLLVRGMAFPTPTELATVAELQIDGIPDGWTRRVLEAGRALILVDGIDEVPPPDREEARRRLADLLAMFSHNRCLVTVRPLAVEPEWLASDRFEELRLLPLRDEDVLAFSTAWHAAARLECKEFRDTHKAATEEENLHVLERALAREFSRNPTLLNLSRTPLLAAVVCALHRRRRGFLPETRWSLYTAALTMLLGTRDTLRRVDAPEGIALGVEEHQQLLQGIAAWLARSGYAEFDHAQARHQIERAMNGMPQVQRQGTTQDVLVHLLNRSGLLQERNDTTIQFIHRTFQDYLAAKEIQESDGLGELLNHADEEQWRDIILLAVGHCHRGEVRRLVDGLIDKGDQANDPRTSAGIHILAAECALVAVILDEDVRDRIADRIRALPPPTDDDIAARLTSLGSYVLPLLPAPEGLDGPAASAVVRVIEDIGGPDTLPLLRRFARQPSREVREALTAAWLSYPAEEYARQVLAHLPLREDIALVVTSPAMITALRHCGPVRQVLVNTQTLGADLAAMLPSGGIRELIIFGNSLLGDLSFTPVLAGLTSLSLIRCQNVRRLSGLTGLPLTSLYLEGVELPKAELLHLGEMDQLRELTLDVTLCDSNIPLPPAHRTVERLSVSSSGEFMINNLTQWPSLRELTVQGRCKVLPLLVAASSAPSLDALEFSASTLHMPLSALPPDAGDEGATDQEKFRLELPAVRRLTLTDGTRAGSATNLAQVFPGLTELHLQYEEKVVLDLTPLQHYEGLVIRVNGRIVPPDVLEAPPRPHRPDGNPPAPSAPPSQQRGRDGVGCHARHAERA